MSTWPMLVLYLQERQAFGWAKRDEAVGRDDIRSANAWEHYAQTMKVFIDQAQQAASDSQARNGVRA
jgi:hypothetical protein